MKLLAIDNPEIKKDPKYQENLKKVEEMAEKYHVDEPQRGHQKEAQKNRGIER